MPCHVKPGSDPPRCGACDKPLVLERVEYERRTIPVWKCSKTGVIIREKA